MSSVVVNLTSRLEYLSLQKVHFMLQSHEMRLEQYNTTIGSKFQTWSLLMWPIEAVVETPTIEVKVVAMALETSKIYPSVNCADALVTFPSNASITLMWVTQALNNSTTKMAATQRITRNPEHQTRPISQLLKLWDRRRVLGLYQHFNHGYVLVFDSVSTNHVTPSSSKL